MIRITSTDDSEPPPAFSDISDISGPTASLSSVQDFNETMPYAETMPCAPAWYDLASHTSLLRDAIWAVTGLGAMLGLCDRAYDIYEVALKPLVGDWAGMAATGHALKQIANAGIDLDVNIGWGAEGTVEIWSDHAADNAVAHLNLLRKSLFEANTLFLRIGQEYQACAEAVYAMASVVGVLLCDVTDAAIAAAAGAACAADDLGSSLLMRSPGTVR